MCSPNFLFPIKSNPIMRTKCAVFSRKEDFMKVIRILLIMLIILAALHLVMLITWPKELILSGFCLVIAYLMMRRI
jgi:hypothetical protein